MSSGINSLLKMYDGACSGLVLVIIHAVWGFWSGLILYMACITENPHKLFRCIALNPEAETLRDRASAMLGVNVPNPLHNFG